MSEKHHNLQEHSVVIVREENMCEGLQGLDAIWLEIY